MTDAYGARPNYGELTAILLAGLAHVSVEIGYSSVAATAYNVAASSGFLAYLIWRIRRSPGALRLWGFRTDNFLPAMTAHFRFIAVGVTVLAGVAIFADLPGLPRTFWLTAALYPAWGIAQQFALQNLIARNIAGIVSKRLAIAVLAALLFAASHFPRLELVALTFVAGIFFTLTYLRYPNLWAVGTAHGLLGSMAFYIVLREDPGAVIIDFLMGN